MAFIIAHECGHLWSFDVISSCSSPQPWRNVIFGASCLGAWMYMYLRAVHHVVPAAHLDAYASIIGGISLAGSGLLFAKTMRSTRVQIQKFHQTKEFLADECAFTFLDPAEYAGAATALTEFACHRTLHQETVRSLHSLRDQLTSCSKKLWQRMLFPEKTTHPDPSHRLEKLLHTVKQRHPRTATAIHNSWRSASFRALYNFTQQHRTYHPDPKVNSIVIPRVERAIEASLDRIFGPSGDTAEYSA